jgi:hypothetical protein
MLSIPLAPLFGPLDHRRSIPLSEVAELTGFAVRTLQAMAKRGAIPGAFKATGRNYRSSDWRFHRDQLELWWSQQGQPKEKRIREAGRSS